MTNFFSARPKLQLSAILFVVFTGLFVASDVLAGAVAVVLFLGLFSSFKAEEWES